MCGVPFHAGDGYVARLVKKGFRVAICEQVEDPRKAKGLVKREVVRVVSPGTLTDAGYLDAREPAFLMAVAGEAGRLGAALIDLSTGEFTTAEYEGPGGLEALADDLAVLRPREVVLPGGVPLPEPLLALVRQQAAVTEAEAWSFEPEAARRALLDQLGEHAKLGHRKRAQLHLKRNQSFDGRLDRLRHRARALVGLDVGRDAAQHAQDKGAGAHGGISQRDFRRGQTGAALEPGGIEFAFEFKLQAPDVFKIAVRHLKETQ